MSKYDERKITKLDSLIMLIGVLMALVFAIVVLQIKPEPQKETPPPNYNLLCKKNFDIPSKFNVVLECMHIRTEGN